MPAREYRQQQGFTLIELMIVIVIISILAGIALPSYNSYVTRSKLAEVQANLTDLRTRMEQYYQDYRNYGYMDGAGKCGMVDSSTAKVDFSTTNPNFKYFTYSCTVSSSQQAYSITTASKVGVSSVAGDYTYTIDQTNSKTTTKFKGANQTGKNCWLMTGSEC